MKKKCPLIGKECVEHGCTFWVHLVGKDPQTGAEKDDWNCAISFLPILLVENAGVMRHVQAGVDKVANVTNGVVGAVHSMNQNFCSAAQTALEMKETNLRLLDAEKRELPNAQPGE